VFSQVLTFLGRATSPTKSCVDENLIAFLKSLLPRIYVDTAKLGLNLEVTCWSFVLTMTNTANDLVLLLPPVRYGLCPSHVRALARALAFGLQINLH